jgi:hypothetical protein
VTGNAGIIVLYRAGCDLQIQDNPGVWDVGHSLRLAEDEPVCSGIRGRRFAQDRQRVSVIA